MSEDIKEILLFLEFTKNEDIKRQWLFKDEAILLLDYITNLQEAIKIKNQRINEEQQEKERYIKFYNELNIWNKELQEENEGLNKELEKYKEIVFICNKATKEGKNE